MDVLTAIQRFAEGLFIEEGKPWAQWLHDFMSNWCSDRGGSRPSTWVYQDKAGGYMLRKSNITILNTKIITI